MHLLIITIIIIIIIPLQNQHTYALHLVFSGLLLQTCFVLAGIKLNHLQSKQPFVISCSSLKLFARDSVCAYAAYEGLWLKSVSST